MSRASSGHAGRTQVTEPRDLVVDLRVVREKGLGHLRQYSTPALTVACGLYGAATDDMHRPAAVEALLRQAVEKMGGGKSGEAASYTFGLVQGTRLWNTTDRRKAAAKAQGVSMERFRRGYESVLIDQMAEGILTLLYERSQQRLPVTPLAEIPDPLHPTIESPDGLTKTTVEQALASRLHAAGVIDFRLSRSDYTTTLAQFLEQAQSSILMISMSLKTKGAKNEILQLFQRCLARSPQFRIIISLIKPGSPGCQAASVILGVPHGAFRSEVESMLTDLAVMRDSLPAHQASRFYLLQHGVIPSFSGILIDDGLSSAQLQTEAKLYDSPRSDSYGFTLVSGGRFYQRQRLAYYRIIRDADPFPEGAERPVLPAEL